MSSTLLQQQGGLRLTPVSYRGGGPALQNALSGQVPLFVPNVVIISQHIPAGALRPSASPRRRNAHLPGAETFSQQGFAAFKASTWWAFLGRAGTPPAILKRMEDALRGAFGERRVAGPHR